MSSLVRRALARGSLLGFDGTGGGSGNGVFDTLTVDGEQIYAECIDVREFGADPNNGDTPGVRAQKIQNAIDFAAAQTNPPQVCLPGDNSTVWLIGRRNTTAGDGTVKSCIDLKTGVRLVGNGPKRTILKLAPDNYAPGGDLHIVRARDVSNCGLYNLTVDGNKANVTADTQTHNIRLEVSAANVKGVTVENVISQNAVGDGFYLLGSASFSVTLTDILGCTFLNNGRSGITVQSGAHKTRVMGCYFEGTTDQDIDMEPTGVSGPTDWMIVNNHFNHAGASTLSLTLSGASGIPDFPSLNNIVAHNIIFGNVQAVRASKLLFHGNRIYGTVSGIRGLSITRACDTVRISHNWIEANAEAAVHIGQASGDFPVNFTVDNNDLVSTSLGVDIESPKELTIEHNRIRRVGGVLAGSVGVQVRGTFAGGGHIRVVGNSYESWAQGEVYNGATEALNGVQFGYSRFLSCSEARFAQGTVTNVTQVGPDSYTSVTTPLNGLTVLDPIVVGCVGSGELVQLYGEPDPTAGGGIAAALGSLYHRSDGFVYRKKAAANTAWQPLGVFGSEYAQNESAGTQNTTSATFQDALSLVVSSLPSGTYRVAARAIVGSTTTDVEVRLRDDTGAANIGGASASVVGVFADLPWSTSGQLTFSGSRTFKVQWRSPGGVNNASIREIRIEFWRIS